ncbi:MAG: VWA domain-containing protein, partial [Betaproteobacteria bacterium]
SSGSKVYAIPGGQFFGLEIDGQSFVYVVDCSGSMSGAPFRRAQDEIMRSVASLTTDQSFFVVFFSNDELPMFSPSVTSTLMPATPTNIDRLRKWVQGMQSDGGTNPMTALHRALQLRPDAVYLLTDGELEGDVMSLVTNSNPSGVRINTVCFMNRGGEALLKQIAGKTGGVHLFVP